MTRLLLPGVRNRVESPDVAQTVAGRVLAAEYVHFIVKSDCRLVVPRGGACRGLQSRCQCGALGDGPGVIVGIRAVGTAEEVVGAGSHERVAHRQGPECNDRRPPSRGRANGVECRPGALPAQDEPILERLEAQSTDRVVSHPARGPYPRRRESNDSEIHGCRPEGGGRSRFSFPAAKRHTPASDGPRARCTDPECSTLVSYSCIFQRAIAPQAASKRLELIWAGEQT